MFYIKINTTPVFKRKVYLLFVKSQNISGFLSVFLTESILKKSIHIPLQGPFAKQMEQPMQVDIGIGTILMDAKHVGSFHVNILKGNGV